MARLPRLTLPGLPHYVVLRGNNLQPIFVDGQDYAHMKAVLAEMAGRFGVQLHAFALLPNQLHLLLTPEQADSLPQFMQSVGRTYVRSFNNRHGRSGTLWEGRYRATVLEPQSWMLPAMVVLECQPVDEGVTSRAVDYGWSSARHHVGAQTERMLRLHPSYWKLGNTPFAREAAYAELLDRGPSAEVREVVLQAALRAGSWARTALCRSCSSTPRGVCSARKPGDPCGRCPQKPNKHSGYRHQSGAFFIP